MFPAAECEMAILELIGNFLSFIREFQKLFLGLEVYFKTYAKNSFTRQL